MVEKWKFGSLVLKIWLNGWIFLNPSCLRYKIRFTTIREAYPGLNRYPRGPINWHHRGLNRHHRRIINRDHRGLNRHHIDLNRHRHRPEGAYITYDKFRCEIISVKRCPTENLLHRKFSMTWFQWIFGELLKFHRNLYHQKYHHRNLWYRH